MIKKIWSWKWRIVTLIIFVMAFLSRYEDGIIYATLNLMGVYAIYALGQFVADEIKSAGVYRIKPEPNPDVEKFFILEANPILGLRLNEIAGFKKQPHEDWIRVVFDGETAKMKSAEVLK